MNASSSPKDKDQENKTKNLDEPTVKGFGEEWAHFDQTKLANSEREKIFQDYFHIFPWHLLPPSGGIGLDAGCGSGRWAQVVAPKVEKLYLLDASEKALSVAKCNLSGYPNVEFLHSSIQSGMLPENSLDFAYSLGVLHHLPNPTQAMTAIAKTLKPGAPLLVYLYFSFDNKPFYYQFLWQISNIIRILLSRSPFKLRVFFSEIIAYTVYWPLARTALCFEKWFGQIPQNWPLLYYRNKSLYTMRTDALDRFGTRLESRFSKVEIAAMLETAGFEKITFSNSSPYWCAIAFNKSA